MLIISTLATLIGRLGQDHTESDQLFMEGYSYYSPRSWEEAQRLQDALLRTFNRLGLVGLIEEVIDHRFRRWNNFNKLPRGQQPKHDPKDWDKDFCVDIMKPHSNTWYDMRVSCWSSASAWLNTTQTTYDNRLCIIIAKGPTEGYRWGMIFFGADGVLEIKGERVTFKGKLPTDPTEKVETIKRALMTALTNPGVYERKETIPLVEAAVG